MVTHDEILHMLKKCRDAFAKNDAAMIEYLNSDNADLPNFISLAEELDVFIYLIERSLKDESRR